MTFPKPSRKHWVIFSVIAFVLFVLLFVYTSLSDLRWFATHYSKIFGYPGTEKTYLVILQNNTELRPTGGFISAYGILRFKHGLFAGFDIHDVYDKIDDHPYIEPPYPLKELLGHKFYKGHSFRDANFYPDFPKSVSELKKFFAIAYPDAKLDGVFAVNYSVMEDLLGSLGSVGLDNRVYTKENLFEFVEFQVHNIDRHSEKVLDERKNVLGALAGKFVKKAAFSPLRWRLLSDVITRNLREKNIQLYFEEQWLKDAISQKGWGGGWPQAIEGDFLAINEGNYGGMKSDRYIQRNVQYFVEAEENATTGVYQFSGRLFVDFFHNGDDNIPLSGDYRGYVRVYVLKGTQISVGPPGYRVFEEGNFTVIGTTIQLKPGGRLQLVYEYILPSYAAKRDSYRLHIEKQSGTSDHYRVTFKALPGKGLKSDDFEVRENVAFFDGILNRSPDLNTKITPDVLPPRVISQDFLDLKTVSIYFNEIVARSAAEDLLNYSIRDANVTHPETTDGIFIEEAKHFGKEVQLKFHGVTRQKTERYKLTLRNMRDLSGNFVEPNPMEITIVQPLEEF